MGTVGTVSVVADWTCASMLAAEELTIARGFKMNVHSFQPKKSRYRAPSPSEIKELSLREVLEKVGREPLRESQYDFLGGDGRHDATIFAVGNLGILNQKCVSIVGTREVSNDGRMRAKRLAKELSQAGVAIVSGLARGIDTAALTKTIEQGGATVAVIGTPVTKAYPAENAHLQEEIYSRHLLVSPFSEGEGVFKSNFPKRNRVMAALSDATVIIEASDSSGTLHQAAECQRLKRWLFIARSVVDDSDLTWPSKFIGKPKVGVLNSAEDILSAIERA